VIAVKIYYWEHLPFDENRGMFLYVKKCRLYLETSCMKYTFVAEIKSRKYMDDDPANILMLTLI